MRYIVFLKSIELNHTIVWYRDQQQSADFLANVPGLPAPRRFMHFQVVDLANRVSLDDYESAEHLALQHDAFLAGDAKFDLIHARLRAQDIAVWAGPARSQPGQSNHHFGGRSVYFQDPDGHLLEISTRPYGNTA